MLITDDNDDDDDDGEGQRNGEIDREYFVQFFCVCVIISASVCSNRYVCFWHQTYFEKTFCFIFNLVVSINY